MERWADGSGRLTILRSKTDQEGKGPREGSERRHVCDAHNDEGDYVLNRARLYRDRRDFIIQPGDSGIPEVYPINPLLRT